MHKPILVLIGTKAQFIKTAPILRELDARHMPYRLVYTGQHSETFDLLERAFGTRPPDELLVRDFEAATHGSFLAWTWRFWVAAGKRVRHSDWKNARIALVHGDTASTLFGALAARLAGVRVAHIEGGLRSPRLLEPFPEEIIRRIVSRISAVHFAPDGIAAANLRGQRGLVVETRGNSLRDALAMALSRWDALPELGGEGGYAIASIHRSENMTVGANLDLLMEAVLATAAQSPLKFVLHPVTRERIRASGWLERLQRQRNLTLLDRMGYPDFVRLLLGASFLMTDGGSNQEEAAMIGLPTLLLRRATERPDGLGDNVVLSELDRNRIQAFVEQYAGGKWPLRSIDGPSPSAIVVDALRNA